MSKDGLTELEVNVAKNYDVSTGYYVGGMKERDLKISEGKQVIFATFPMAQEGLDIPGLDTLLLTSPKSNVIQAVGRILRKVHTERNPLIVDFVDTFSMFAGQARKRLTYYTKQKYKVVDLEISYDPKSTDQEKKAINSPHGNSCHGRVQS